MAEAAGGAEEGATEESLDLAGITCNKNAIPNDPEKPFVTSGIRLGTASVTTTGMAEPEMAEIAELIGTVLRAPEDESVRGEVLGRVHALCSKFVPYPGLYD